MRPADNTHRLFRQLHLKAGAELDEKVHSEISRALKKSAKTKSTVIQPNVWRIIMNSKMTKLGVAAVIMIGAFLGLHFIGGPDMASPAWADVLENIRNSKTLTFVVRADEEGPALTKVMVIDPYLFRWEILGEQEKSTRYLSGQIFIVDAKKGKGLILDRVGKKAKVRTADKAMPPIYDAFRNFRDMEDFSVEKAAVRRIGDKQAPGFKLREKSGTREIMVWADPETRLPILMEETLENAQGEIGRYFVTDIVFDAELDGSLFSVKPPEGYEVEEADHESVVNRVKSAVNMDRILKACRAYAAEHDNHWPENLKELTGYGIDEETFVNPRQPNRQVGYIYLKPPVNAPSDRIVLYEAWDTWCEGINVGYADFRVQFVRDELEFAKQLKESSQSN